MTTESLYITVLEQHGFQKEQPQYGVDLNRYVLRSNITSPNLAFATLEHDIREGKTFIRVRGTGRKGGDFDTGHITPSEIQLHSLFAVLIPNA